MSNRTTRLLALVLAGVFSTGAFAQEGDVKYRQAIMKTVGGHAGAVAQIAYGGVGHTSHLKGHAHALLEVTKLVVTAFEANAMTEDPPTRAKPEIWAEWDKFKQKANDLEEAAAAVAAAADTGDTGAVAAALDPLWDACKGCHKPYRTD